jgi:hypothetical protein
MNLLTTFATLPKTAKVVLSATALAMTLAVAPASYVQADVIRPAYFLYSINVQGPCVKSPSKPAGTVKLSPYRAIRYNYGGTRSVPNTNFEERWSWHRGFSTAFRQIECTGRGGFIHRFYGNQKITQKVTQIWFCSDEPGRCQYLKTKYGAWYNDSKGW